MWYVVSVMIIILYQLYEPTNQPLIVYVYNLFDTPFVNRCVCDPLISIEHGCSIIM